MAVLTGSNNRVLYVTRQEDIVLNFTVKGTLFPHRANPEVVSQLESYLTFTSTAPNRVHVDWGDGTTDVYDMLLNAGVYRVRFLRYLLNSPPSAGTQPFDAPIHYYQDLGVLVGTVDDNLEVYRQITFRFEFSEYINSITSNLNRFYETLPVGLGSLRGLDRLNIANCYNVDRVPASLFRTNIKELRLTSIGEAYRLAIPEWTLNSPLVLLSLSGNNYNDHESSNLNKINLLKNTLTELILNGNNLEDLPVEISDLNITSLSINSNSFTIIPSVVNSITTLQHLNFLAGYSSTSLVMEWGDISNLTNLISLTYLSAFGSGSNQFTVNLPAYFVNFTKLRTVLCSSVFFQTQIRCDTHVEEWYSLINNNASKSVGNTAFRNITFTYHSTNFPQYNLRPSGIYQQPAGYVQGVSNGTPVSPMEMIWVMVNQYGHTWTVKPL